MKKGNCPVCKQRYTQKNQRSEHHVLPRRFFFGYGRKEELCRSCHNLLELLIPEKTKLLEKEYERIFSVFMRWRKGEIK